MAHAASGVTVRTVSMAIHANIRVGAGKAAHLRRRIFILREFLVFPLAMERFVPIRPSRY
ncbi:hypothetical protein GCM10011289_29800 [Paludibacterium paludis]|uniref:Uncharacterized protein n=1 Tax=Paludibacterium paludis TaxID=1225769 RepID=A0A918P614_9NEIS|nr:hypothetical protein GCM10011289_29800 [Paludibacterium paludis]